MYECLNCNRYGEDLLDVHGRCRRCGSESWIDAERELAKKMVAIELQELWGFAGLELG